MGSGERHIVLRAEPLPDVVIGDRFHILTELVERLQVALPVDHLGRHIAAHSVGTEDGKDLVAGLQSTGKLR